MISEIITSRRAVYPIQYNGSPIAEREIHHLLQAANWAPTHRRTEPWRFKVFHSESSRQSLSDFMGEAYRKTAVPFSEVKFKKVMEKPLQSAAVLAICMQRDPKESVPEWEEIASVAMAVQNMWLLATEFGIGSYWSTPGFRTLFGDYFPMEKGEQCLGFFYMGKYDGELPEGTRNSTIAEKTTWM